MEIVKTKYFFRDENSIHPPLYELFLHTVAILHPESFEQDYPKEEDNRFWLRILPAMFGILCIPLTYWVGLRLAGKWEGLVAATLTAFSVFHIFYSQECRPYILMSVWTLIAMVTPALSARASSSKRTAVKDQSSPAPPHLGS